MGNLLQADHQASSAGQLQINRGSDELLINAKAPIISGDSDVGFYSQSQYGNLVAVDSNGDVDAGGTPLNRAPFSEGIWYGTPGVVVNAYGATTDHVYLSGDYHNAYSPQDTPGSGSPASELTRQVVYLRPNDVIVYDRVTTLKASYPKQLRWHFNHGPELANETNENGDTIPTTTATLAGNSWVAATGNSKLFGQTFSTTPLTTTLAEVQVGATLSPHVQRLITQPTVATTSVRYVTALQVAPSSTTTMDATTSILSTDGRLEGVQMGNQVVLFGRNGDLDPATPVTYAVNATGPLQHLLTNLRAGLSYLVQVNGTPLTTVTASAQGTLSFRTSGAGNQTITIAQAP
jgi:hypothetical protein